MRGIVGWVLVPVLVLIAGRVSAQCTKDTDCKGDRVCEAGACTSPLAPAAPPANTAGPDAAPPAQVVGEALPPAPAVESPPVNLALPPPPPPSELPPPPPEPTTHRRSKPALIAGIVMVSAGPIALLGAVAASNAQKRCDDQLEADYPGRALPSSEKYRVEECNDYSVPVYLFGISGAVLTAAGIPLIIYGAKTVQDAPASGSLQLQPWATPSAGGMRLRLTL